MKLNEIRVEHPLVWDLTKQRLEKGEKVLIRASTYGGMRKPDATGNFPVTRVSKDASGSARVYFVSPLTKNDWVELDMNDDDVLELKKQGDGSFLLQYIDPEKWITT